MAGRRGPLPPGPPFGGPRERSRSRSPPRRRERSPGREFAAAPRPPYQQQQGPPDIPFRRPIRATADGLDAELDIYYRGPGRGGGGRGGPPVRPQFSDDDEEGDYGRSDQP